MNDNYIEFCKYINPIITGCAGFIRTTGYIAHIPGYIIMMSEEETFVNIINIPVIFNIVIIAKINDLLKLKEENDMLNILQNTYFLGNNIRYNNLIKYFNLYNSIDNMSNCIYLEDDCYNISGFDERVKNSDIGFINIPYNNRVFMIPASKSITNLNKSDKVSLKIYNYIENIYNNNIKTIKYSVYKNKFKLIVNIFCNIIVV